ncbi:unnamed protein product, partial [Amoebophrya sp. A120]
GVFSVLGALAYITGVGVTYAGQSCELMGRGAGYCCCNVCRQAQLIGQGCVRAGACVGKECVKCGVSAGRTATAVAVGGSSAPPQQQTMNDGGAQATSGAPSQQTDDWGLRPDEQPGCWPCVWSSRHIEWTGRPSTPAAEAPNGSAVVSGLKECGRKWCPAGVLGSCCCPAVACSAAVLADGSNLALRIGNGAMAFAGTSLLVLLKGLLGLVDVMSRILWPLTKFAKLLLTALWVVIELFVELIKDGGRGLVSILTKAYAVLLKGFVFAWNYLAAPAAQCFWNNVLHPLWQNILVPVGNFLGVQVTRLGSAIVTGCTAASRCVGGAVSAV